MPFEMRIQDTDMAVTATPLDQGGRFQLRLGEKTWEGHIAMRETHGLRLQGAGGAMDVWVARDETGMWIWHDGRARLVLPADTRRGRRRGQGAGLAKEVTPPMPAVVMALLVNEGDRVTKGQGLVVVSAMKMEMTLVAPFDGRVTALRASVGAKVNPGEILVDIAPAEEMTEEIQEAGHD